MKNVLNNYFAGLLSEDGKEGLFLQINSDPLLKEEFSSLQNLWAISGMMENEGDDKWVQNSYNQITEKINKRKKRQFYFSFLKYAAAAVVLFSVWFISRKFDVRNNNNDFICIEVPIGQHTSINLADGSQVWLHSRSKLKIPGNFNKKDRRIELDGEGFFSISKNEEKPFIVKTKQYNIRVTGTRFNLFAYDESSLFETDLTEGSVTIYNRENPEERLSLSPNEKGFTEAGSLKKITYHFTETNFQEGIYSFDKKTLKEIAGHLELWYDVKINITKTEISNQVFSCKFRITDTIEVILNAFKETNNFDFRVNEDTEIEIY